MTIYKTPTYRYDSIAPLINLANSTQIEIPTCIFNMARSRLKFKVSIPTARPSSFIDRIRVSSLNGDMLADVSDVCYYYNLARLLNNGEQTENEQYISEGVGSLSLAVFVNQLLFSDRDLYVGKKLLFIIDWLPSDSLISEIRLELAVETNQLITRSLLNDFQVSNL